MSDLEFWRDHYHEYGAGETELIEALEARVTELTSAARELLEATDTLAIAAARHHLRRTLAAEEGDNHE